MVILITGGLGQVGSYLCERLSDSNEVTILDNFSNNLNNIELSSDVKIIRERVSNGQNPVIFGDGNQSRDFVYIEDVVYAIFKAMENKRAIGEIFNIGTGRPTRIKELAEVIIKISNKKLKPEFAPEQVGDIRESYADITKAEEIMGYKPEYLLEQGLRLCANYK
ncbi:MAG: GDP-mannose 4,6-dehydratase [Nitrospirae bacterium]|nr:GDP-mannose 4,6-dehydratase [Nitrospirota bacterium]